MGSVTPAPDHSYPLVGRGGELDRLRRLIGADRSSAASAAIVLGGDAGVGKTRVLGELATVARDGGWAVLVGHCLDFGDGALSYLPFTEILGRLAADSPATAIELAEAHPALTRLMPGRRMLLDSEHAQSEPMSKADLLEAVHAALEQLGGHQPVVVAVEDVHWADQSSREMLSFLFARGFTTPVTVVASYRTDDLHRRHPLRALLAEWSRLPAVSRVQLEPLADADIRGLVRTIHPAPMREVELQTIVSRAEGNAFFAEELVDASTSESKALPNDLSRLLLVRLDQLDDAGKAVVRAASVAGRRVSHELLSRVVDLSPSSLDAAMRSAVESNVLVPAGSDGYAFRHALLAEAVYDDLLPGERVRLHGAYTAVLRSRDIPGTAAELARHARKAHDIPAAVLAGIEAGDDAMSVGGPDEAARHYVQALELVAGLPADAAEVDAIELTVKASEAVTAAGRQDRAVDLVQDQLNQLTVPGRPLDRAKLLLALAAAAVLADATVDVLAATTEALGLVPAEPATALRARLLAVHARANLDRRRDDEAFRWADAAIDMGRELGLGSVVSDATTTLAKLQDRAGNPEESLRALQRIAEQAQADGDAMAELRSLHHIGSLHFTAGRLAEALAVYHEATARAEKVGRPWAPYGLDVRLMAAITAYYLGEWDTARAVVDVTGQSPSAMAEASLTAVGLSVSAGRGDSAALELLPHLRSWWSRDGFIAVLSGGAAIDLYGDADDVTTAVEVYDSMVGAVSSLWQVTAFQARIRLSALVLGQLANQAGRLSANERVHLADRAAELLAAATEAHDRHKEMGVVGPEADAWMARVGAEHLRLCWLTGVEQVDEPQLVAAWEQTVDAFERLGHVFELARSQCRLAAVLRATGHVRESRALAGRARDTARHLAAKPLLAELKTLGSGPTASRGRPGDRRHERLTPREQEILGLVAKGRSNAEIARQLFISAKTVSVHVSNILAKLDASGRTEAAALARERGLLPD